jgi:hypothetical protein
VLFKSSPNKTLDEYIVDNLKFYIVINLGELAIKINRVEWVNSDAKNNISRVSRALLEEVANTRTEKADSNFLQFKKAGLIERAVNLEATGALRQSISFPAFKWVELANEELWEDSDLYERITSKFFFTVFKKTNHSLPIFLGSFFWTMPEKDILVMKEIWEETRQYINNNDYASFVRISDDRIGHIRPHALNTNDTSVTPQGDLKTKHSFWLNNTYILKIINQHLKL